MGGFFLEIQKKKKKNCLTSSQAKVPSKTRFSKENCISSEVQHFVSKEDMGRQLKELTGCRTNCIKGTLQLWEQVLSTSANEAANTAFKCANWGLVSPKYI